MRQHKDLSCQSRPHFPYLSSAATARPDLVNKATKVGQEDKLVDCSLKGQAAIQVCSKAMTGRTSLSSNTMFFSVIVYTSRIFLIMASHNQHEDWDMTDYVDPRRGKWDLRLCTRPG